MSIDWHPVASYAIQALTPIIMAVVTVLLGKLAQLIARRHGAEQANDALDRLFHATSLAVAEVAQTSLDAARKAAGEGNSLPKDVAAAALKAALDTVKTYTSQADAGTIAKAFGLDTPEKLEAFMVSTIEKMVASSKHPLVGTKVKVVHVETSMPADPELHTPVNPPITAP